MARPIFVPLFVRRTLGGSPTTKWSRRAGDLHGKMGGMSEHSEQSPDPRVVPGTSAPRPEQQSASSSGTSAVQVASIGEPGKLMRIGGMIKQLLDEVRSAPLDAEARARMADIHERSVQELETGLSPELAEELHRIRLPFADGETPSAPELRVAQAQLVGWLEGVFHGLQAAMAAQQLANQQLAQQMAMRQLPPGTQVAPGIVINEQGEPERVGAPGQTPGPGPQSPTQGQRPGGDGGFGQYL